MVSLLVLLRMATCMIPADLLLGKTYCYVFDDVDACKSIVIVCVAS